MTTGRFHAILRKACACMAIVAASMLMGSMAQAQTQAGRAPRVQSTSATDFWNRTSPADWSQREIQDFLTKSPWVHYFRDIRVPSDAVGRGGRRALVSSPDVVIRWESAALVRAALARIESKEYNDALAGFSKDYYVIAVIHVMKGTGQSGLSSHWSREQEEELRNNRAAQAGQHGLLRQSGPPGPSGEAPANVLTNSDVVKMAKAKLGDGIIISMIKTSACNFDTSVDALAKLKEAGVSGPVIQAMHAEPQHGAPTPPPPVPEQTRNWGARRVFSQSWLLRPGYEAISPARVESGENAEGRVDLVMFLRAVALENGDGDIDVKTAFWVGMGESRVTVRFSLKKLAEGSGRGL